MREFTVAALLAITLAVTSCAPAVHTGAQVADDEDVPFGLLDPDAPPIVPTTSAGPAPETVELCFVRDGRLVLATRALPPPADLQTVIDALGSPPSDSAAPLRTALPDPGVIGDVDVLAGIARVDLGQSIADLGGDDQLLAVAQIVCTLTARPGVGQVSFTLEGAPVDVPRGDGSVVSHPVSRDDYARLLTPLDGGAEASNTVTD